MLVLDGPGSPVVVRAHCVRHTWLPFVSHHCYGFAFSKCAGRTRLPHRGEHALLGEPGAPWRAMRNSMTHTWSSSPHFLLLAHPPTDFAFLPCSTQAEGDEEPNDTYVEQLTACAQAAVDELQRRGISDPSRIAVAGHSYGAPQGQRWWEWAAAEAARLACTARKAWRGLLYCLLNPRHPRVSHPLLPLHFAGAFMTANLLAHAGHLFACGIARSGTCWLCCWPALAASAHCLRSAAGVCRLACPAAYAPFAVPHRGLLCSPARCLVSRRAMLLPRAAAGLCGLGTYATAALPAPPGCRRVQPHTHALWLPGGGAHLLAGALEVQILQLAISSLVLLPVGCWTSRPSMWLPPLPV